MIGHNAKGSPKNKFRWHVEPLAGQVVGSGWALLIDSAGLLSGIYPVTPQAERFSVAFTIDGHHDICAGSAAVRLGLELPSRSKSFALNPGLWYMADDHPGGLDCRFGRLSFPAMAVIGFFTRQSFVDPRPPLHHSIDSGLL